MQNVSGTIYNFACPVDCNLHAPVGKSVVQAGYDTKVPLCYIEYNNGTKGDSLACNQPCTKITDNLSLNYDGVVCSGKYVDPPSNYNYAASVEVLTTGQELEKAIHAKDRKQALKYLNRAQVHLSYAQEELDREGSSLGDTLEKTMDELQNIICKTKKEKLSTLQKGIMYDFMGVLGALYEKLSV